MAKRKNDFTSPAEDYIDQLNWRASHSKARNGWRSDSVHYEPKWRYKIVHRYPPTMLLGRILLVLALIGVIILVIYLVSSGMAGETLEAKIFYSVVFGIIFTIIFFAAKDVSKDSDDDSEKLD